MNKAGIKFIYLYCNNLKKMREFYSEILQLNEIYYAEGQALAYDCDGLQFTIFQTKEKLQSEEGWADQPGWEGGTLPKISWSIPFEKQLFKSVVERLIHSEIDKFHSTPLWINYWSFPIKDPAGNSVEIVWDSKEKIDWR